MECRRVTDLAVEDDRLYGTTHSAPAITRTRGSTEVAVQESRTACSTTGTTTGRRSGTRELVASYNPTFSAPAIAVDGTTGIAVDGPSDTLDYYFQYDGTDGWYQQQLQWNAVGETFRGRDGVYRVGGDEFAVILPEISAWDALEAAQRLQTTLAPHAIGVTAGIAAASGPREVDGFIREADLALIAGKRRNQAVTLYSPELEPMTGPSDAARDAEHITSLSTALALAVDAKDSYTRRHCQTVSQLCVLIATEIGLSPALIGQMRLAGLLHDVGKIGVPDAILAKRAQLTDAEYEQMKRHSILGEEIAAAAGLSTEARWIRHHHERFDGSGYPDRFVGKDIPMQARIIHAADAFEAMTSDRPYRLAPGRAFAIAELTRHAGTQFDPEIVHAFCRALESTPDSDTGGHDDGGSDRARVAQPQLIPA